MQVRNSYTRLLVTDVKACFAFYRDIMEFKVIVDASQEGYAEFAAGDMKLAISQRQEIAEMIGGDRLPLHAECQDRVVLVFVVPDVEIVCHELKHKGVKFIREPMGNPSYDLKTAYLRDPDGNLIGIYQQMV
jgi:catechol 2,3-dioxygenase-like lactoylglutathione lyase family enzyme